MEVVGVSAQVQSVIKNPSSYGIAVSVIDCFAGMVVNLAVAYDRMRAS